MIKIDKSHDAPATLQNLATDALQKLHDIHAAGKHICTKDFDTDIYGAQDVRNQLELDQHGKCAYCESLCKATSYLQVEHFRPKSRYYWLAYDWDNLLLACQVCNQQYKGIHFPLADEQRRATADQPDISTEEPLLLNPNTDNPAEHLAFVAATMVHRTEKGRNTISTLGLNRQALHNERERKWNLYQLLTAALHALQVQNPQHPLCQKIINQLAEMRAPQSPYSAMLKTQKQ